MSGEARRDRHYELWKQESASLGRWAFGAVLFATVVLLRVIEPYVETSRTLVRDESRLTEQTKALRAEQRELANAEQLVDDIEKLYEDISDQPWRDSVEGLKRSLERLGEAYRVLEPLSLAELVELLGTSVIAPLGTEGLQIEQAAPERRRGTRRRGTRRSTRLEPLTPSTAAQFLSLGAVQGEGGSALSGRLVERVTNSAADRANTAVAEISGVIEEKVVRPLKRLVTNRGQTELGQALMPIVGQLQQGMVEWSRALLADPDWYRTADRKESVVSGLEEELRVYRTDFKGASDEARKRLRKGVRDRKSLTRKLDKEIEVLAATTERLAGVLDSGLPGWIRGVVSPAQMIQLYPPILLALGIVLIFKTSMTRRHYLAVRDQIYPDRVYRRDASLSSTWTLTHRGTSGTLFTIVVFVGLAALLWWFFVRGLDVALAWQQSELSRSQAGAFPWLAGLRLLGRWCTGAAHSRRF